MTCNKKIYLDEVFSFLERKHIKYVWLHGYNEEEHGDIDLCISAGDIRRLRKIIDEFALEHNFKIVQVLKHEWRGDYYVLVKQSNSDYDFLILDFCSDYMRNKRILLSSYEILKDFRRYNNFYVPAPQIEALYIFLKRTLKGKWLEHHWKQFRELYYEAPDSIYEQIAHYIGENESRAFLKYIDSEDVDSVNKNILRFRLAILSGTIKKKKSNLIKYFVMDSLRRMSRIINPTGLFVVLLGPDGSGKSTIAKETIKEIAPVFRKIKIFHWRPKVFSKLSSIESNMSVTQPHAAKSRGKILSQIKLIYYVLDYVVGYYVRILPLKIKSTLIIFDRYYFDFFIDPKRYRLNTSRLIIKAFYFIIPKPDIIFVLKSDPEKIYERKVEITMEEINRQNKALLDLSKEIKGNFKVLNGNVEICQVTNQAVEQCLNYLSLKNSGNEPV